MFIETALKNICLDVIVNNIHSSDLNDFYKHAVESYNNCPPSYNESERKKAQEKMMHLQMRIQGIISKAYTNEAPTVTHYYNSPYFNSIPLWAIFEHLTLGDFGVLLDNLTLDLRNKIHLRLKMVSPLDTNRKNICDYVYTLKDLRNVIAHNAVVYDGRFAKNQMKAKSQRMREYLRSRYKLQYVKFEDMVDYVILISFFLEVLGETKSSIVAFVKKFEVLTKKYISSIGHAISNITINSNWTYRIDILKANLK